MKTLPSDLDAQALLVEVQRLSYTRDASGIDMAHQQAKGLPSWLRLSESVQKAVDEIQRWTGKTAVGLMVNRLGPGVLVPKHRDAPGDVERWHLPLQTSHDALWWDERDGECHMRAGSWWGPVPYDIDHQVRNRGKQARIHLVVDLH